MILQAEDLKDTELANLLRRNGVLITARLQQLGIMTVEMPAGAVVQIAASRHVSNLSSNREIRVLGTGHIEMTTGAYDVRSQTTSSGASYTLDGTGIGIAIVDSGMDTGHILFKNAASFTVRTSRALA